MSFRHRLERFFFLVFILLFAGISFVPPLILEAHQYAVLVLLAGCFITLCAYRRASIFRKRDIWVWLLCAAWALTFFVCRNTRVALHAFSWIAVSLICIYYLTAEALRSERARTFLIYMVCLGAGVGAVGGIIDVMLQRNPLYELFLYNPYYERFRASGFMRAMSTHCHSPILGSYLIASFPFVIAAIRMQKTRAGRFAGWALSVLMLCAVVLTFSRGVVLALVASLVALALFLKKLRVRIVVYSGLSIAVLMIVAAYLPYPIQKFSIQGFMLYGDGIFSPYRSSRVVMAQHMLVSSPAAGIGLNHFRLRFNEFCPVRREYNPEFLIADNMYLTLIAETGVIGFIAFILFLVSTFHKAALLMKREPIVAYVMAAIVALLTHMFSYELFFWANPYMYLCVLIGIIEAVYRKEKT